MATLDFTTKPLALQLELAELAKSSNITHYIHTKILSYFNFNYSRGYYSFNSTFYFQFQTVHVRISPTLTQSFIHFILYIIHSNNKITSHQTHSHHRKYIIDFTSCLIKLWWPNINYQFYHLHICSLDMFVAWHKSFLLSLHFNNWSWQKVYNHIASKLSSGMAICRLLNVLCDLCPTTRDVRKFTHANHFSKSWKLRKIQPMVSTMI